MSTPATASPSPEEPRGGRGGHRCGNGMEFPRPRVSILVWLGAGGTQRLGMSRWKGGRRQEKEEEEEEREANYC